MEPGNDSFVWVSGYLGIWVPGYLGTWVPGYLGTWIPGDLDTQHSLRSYIYTLYTLLVKRYASILKIMNFIMYVYNWLLNQRKALICLGI